MHEDNGRKFYYNDKMEKVYGDPPIIKKLGQEPAFPMVNSEGVPGLITEPYSDYTQKMYTNGISKRLYIATAAMQSILEHNGFYWQGSPTQRWVYTD